MCFCTKEDVLWGSLIGKWPCQGGQEEVLRWDLKTWLGEGEVEGTSAKQEIVYAKASGRRKQNKYERLKIGQWGCSPESKAEWDGGEVGKVGWESDHM